MSAANILLPLVLVIAALATIKFAKRIFGSWFSPIGLYCGLWFGSLALLYTDIVNYYPLEWPTLLVFGGTIFSFSLGCFLALPFGTNSGQSTRITVPDKDALRHTVYILFILGIIGTIAYYRLLHSYIGIDSLWNSPITVRYEETYGRLRRTGWIGLLRTNLTSTVTLGVIYVLCCQATKRFRVALVVVVSLLLLLPTSGRTTMAHVLIWTVMAATYMNLTRLSGRRTQKKVILASAIAIGLFFVLFTFTTTLLSKTIRNTSGVQATEVSESNQWIVDIDYYIVSPLVAFQQLQASYREFPHSANLTFGVISRILNELEPERFSYPDYIQPYVNTPIPSNMYTYLDVYLLDFGWPGVMVFPCIMGLCCTLLYLKMRARPTPIAVLLASLGAMCIVSTTGVNRFGNLMTWQWAIAPACTLLLVSSRYAQHPRPRVQPPGVGKGSVAEREQPAFQRSD